MTSRCVAWCSAARHSTSTAGQWYTRHPHDAPVLVNMYGITETTVHVTMSRSARHCASGTGSVIGRGIPGLRVLVLDDDLSPVAPGVTGEVYVAGHRSPVATSPGRG